MHLFPNILTISFLYIKQVFVRVLSDDLTLTSVNDDIALIIQAKHKPQNTHFGRQWHNMFCPLVCKTSWACMNSKFKCNGSFSLCSLTDLISLLAFCVSCKHCPNVITGVFLTIYVHYNMTGLTTMAKHEDISVRINLDLSFVPLVLINRNCVFNSILRCPETKTHSLFPLQVSLPTANCDV